ncbi:lipid droplet-associated protein [Nocardia sp. BMG111209]|uniref:lipid droplet-associated protein n=1 Tax=Nocardia sp. BMG111209 TaxID=1160137 RepID=UPI000363A714|nr:lipid droplet-associated protein [Nocardia sp. BMG111209]
MFRPPFIARVAAGAAVYALEETRRLPSVALSLPITAVSRVLQTTMRAQQFVTTLALKGDTVFERLSVNGAEQPEWATFDEDAGDDSAVTTAEPVRRSRFDLYSADPESEADPDFETGRSAADTNGDAADDTPGASLDPEPRGADGSASVTAAGPRADAPEVVARYDYDIMTLAQLRARLRMLDVEELAALLDYEQRTLDRAPFVTMLTNRIATVTAQ